MKPIRVAVAVAMLLLPATAEPAAAVAESLRAVRISGGPTSATDATPVQLDADVRLPLGSGKAPVVVVAHGFGGSKRSVAAQAQQLTDDGFITIAYTARGFGRSGGTITLNAPQFEIADLRRVIDYAARMPRARLDGIGDPRVGVVGASYGGALALLAAGYDKRIDAIASDVPYADLEQALFPQQGVGLPRPGVLKKVWTSYFFSRGFSLAAGQSSLCGRFASQVCALYNDAITNGSLSSSASALLRASSPVSIADRITAPTLLMAGQADSLFTLDQADAVARSIMAAHPRTPLKVVWHSGGHDGGISEQDRLDRLVTRWFDVYLRGRGSVANDFEATLVTGPLLGRRSTTQTEVERSARYPGVHGASQVEVALDGGRQTMLAPPGGAPAAVSSVPGLAALSAVASRTFPGQTAVFESKPLTQSVSITGSSQIRVRVSSMAPGRDVVLFASLRIVTPAGVESLPNGLVAPVRIPSPLPDTVTIDLPAVYAKAEPGDVLRVVLSTTDFVYAMPQQAAVYSVALDRPVLALASGDLVPLHAEVAAWLWIAGAAALIMLLWLLLWLRRPRHRASDTRAELRDVPLAVEHLVKEFGEGLRAVDDISYQVPIGKVIGLLGPNGAGKTTTMRMALGLILPTEGNVYVFGERVTPGNPVLSRVGALVEGPGFLPHLTGRQNLELYWKASGRSGDPKFDDVLKIADLGTAIDRRVRTYSQGMRQRLGVAQAMLGMPDLLVLDEPTNGLDPQQIREMRQVVQDYSATGRTVIVSSHLLSEVEQTCSHVVVMHRGRLVTQGDVDELLAGRSHMHLEDFFMEVIGDDLTIGRV